MPSAADALTASQPLSLILDSVLNTLRARQTVTEDLIRSLALLVGNSTLLDALDLIDKRSVARITTPSGRLIYQVASSGNLAYTVFPILSPTRDDHPDIVTLGYCPCPAFSHAVIARDHSVICKHLLAVHIAMRLSDDTTSSFNEKEMGLGWLAGLATGFRSTQDAAQANAT